LHAPRGPLFLKEIKKGLVLGGKVAWQMGEGIDVSEGGGDNDTGESGGCESGAEEGWCCGTGRSGEENEESGYREGFEDG